MSTITESSTWSATVNQIESGELLEGGAGNLLNQAAGSLANRTLYLRDRLVAIEETAVVITSIRNNNYTVTGKNEYIFADTSASTWSLTLPASPSLGDIVSLNDLAETWDSNNLTVLRNGHNINGLAEDLVCDSNCSIKLIYSNATYGWKIC